VGKEKGKTKVRACDEKASVVLGAHISTNRKVLVRKEKREGAGCRKPIKDRTSGEFW